MKRMLIPVASVLVGVLAFFLTRHYLAREKEELERERRRLLQAAEMTYVICADRDIPSGTVIKNEDIAKIQVPKNTVGERHIMPEDWQLICGKKCLNNIPRKSPILWSDIYEGAREGVGLAPMITVGLRAVSLGIGGTAAVSGMIQPGDRVDVLGTFSFPSKKVPGEVETATITLLQDVTVLATGQRMGRQLPSSRAQAMGGTYSSVTLEVTPREAELLVFAEQSRGKLVLALRNPGDLRFEKEMPVVNFEQIESKLPEINMFRQRNIRHKTGL